MNAPYNEINPLPSCPESPNCIRTSKLIHSDSTAVMRALKNVLTSEAETVEADTDEQSVHAVYRIPVFGWKDDVNILLKEETENKTILYIRSASREGYSDLGVNKRRVNRIIRKTEKELHP
ncbi:DUF1499 domain-containing protein [Balneola sp. MJW-20]|uniref:DUF1499 domain-containing protein n=1 Tax=Gracilimonas aurantiaca TaxID=3234185 RepID=UPI00346538CD